VPPRRDRRDNIEVAKEPARQVEQVNALIEEFSAPGKIAVSTPLLFIPSAPPVAIDATNEKKWP
jgi:hypothetical protein